MTTQGPSPLAPTTILASKPISQSAAHDFLAAYLDRASTDPALQPNAGISEHGPVSRTTAAAPNLILHNLKRVQAGLVGEVLGRDLALAKIEAEQGDYTNGNGNVVWEDPKVEVVNEDEGEGEGEGEGVEEDQEQQLEVVGVDDTETIDKEDRKKKKKERRLAEKRAKANKKAEE